MREGRVDVRPKAPYSDGPIDSQKVAGRCSTKLILIGAFAKLKPYFHGMVNRIGPPFCGGRGLPYRPVEMNARSFAASSIVTPSMWGKG
jgi:hypothetical protein